MTIIGQKPSSTRVAEMYEILTVFPMGFPEMFFSCQRKNIKIPCKVGQYRGCRLFSAAAPLQQKRLQKHTKNTFKAQFLFFI